MTETIHSSCRLYFESIPLQLEPGERIAPPCGIAHFAKEAPFPPRSWIERGYNIHHWSDLPGGGHFAAMEEPDALANDISEFFGSLRHEGIPYGVVDCARTKMMAVGIESQRRLWAPSTPARKSRAYAQDDAEKCCCSMLSAER